MYLFSMSVVVLVSVVIMSIGLVYLLNPRAAVTGFGLPLPEAGANVDWWLRLKGVRDVVSGLLMLALLTWSSPRIVGIGLLGPGHDAVGRHGNHSARERVAQTCFWHAWADGHVDDRGRYCADSRRRMTISIWFAMALSDGGPATDRERARTRSARPDTHRPCKRRASHRSARQPNRAPNQPRRRQSNTSCTPH